MPAPVLITAGLSVRAMTASARRTGMQVMALDAFGDADTRRHAHHWEPIARAGAMRIDASLAHDALERLASTPGLLGWVPGAGFERWPAGLVAHAIQPRLLGNTPASWHVTRNPEAFFDVLDALNIAHPAVQLQAPSSPAGWLRKDMHGAGGWHIRAARRHDATRPGRYWQAVAQGSAMGALFIANGKDSRTIGVHRLLTATHAARRGMPACGFAGMIGPLPLPLSIRTHIDAIIEKLVPACSLVGLCSLDLLLDEDTGTLQVLEINPRPSASLVLYDQDFERGLMHAHVDACLHGQLPPSPHMRAAPPMRGEQVVFAPCAFTLHADLALALTEAAVRDQPIAGTTFSAGDPVCSVSAQGQSEHEVRAALSAATERTHLLMHTAAHIGALP